MHDGTPRARRAGAIYSALALLGEAAPADGLRAAGGRHARRQPADPRRRRGAADLALARRDAGAADRGLRAEDRARAAARLDAARLSGGADAGRGGAERRGRQGRRDRADPLPAARRSRCRAGARRSPPRAVHGLLRRRGRHHAAQPEDGARLLQREPDGVLAAVLGMGLAAGDASTASAASFYAAHHVLVKGGLFLALGVAATTGAPQPGSCCCRRPCCR